ncbi:5165_t:CDS:1, partial [Dentiscutata erythropus]
MSQSKRKFKAPETSLQFTSEKEGLTSSLTSSEYTSDLNTPSKTSSGGRRLSPVW